MTVDFAKAALEYAKIGWRTFPLAPGTKIPAIAAKDGGHGVKDATDYPDDLLAFAKRFPNANVGLACGVPSGIVVVDIDPRNGGDQSLAAYAAKGHILPPGPRARTGNGGLHYFFRHQVGITNSKGRLARGIDIKSTGGYVVAAPSEIGKSDSGPGGSYVWEVSPFNAPIPRLPIWVMSALMPAKRPAYGSGNERRNFDADALGTLSKFVSKSPVGERSNRLYWSSCRAAEGVLKHKISLRAAETELLREAVATGLTPNEALATIRSAFGMVMKTK